MQNKQTKKHAKNKKKNDEFMVTAGDFNILLSEMDSSSKQKISKDTF